jgi:flavin-dependent dehydrogenase
VGAVRQHGSPLIAWHAHTIRERDVLPARIFLEATPDGWWYVGRSSRDRVAAINVLDANALQWPRDRDAFVERLRGSSHLGRFAGTAGGWSAPCASPAGGSWLPAVAGEGWAACGDAAITFDPIAGHGVINALISGAAAAQAISAPCGSHALAELAVRHLQLRLVYERRRAQVYASERRWAAHPFWLSQAQRETPEVTVVAAPWIDPGRHEK